MNDEPRPGWAVIKRRQPGSTTSSWYSFHSPLRILRGFHLADIPALLDEVENAVSQGAYAVGALAYESARALNPELSTHVPDAEQILLWFGLYDTATHGVIPPDAGREFQLGPWTCLNEDGFAHGVSAINAAIARGETYQVNFTFPHQATFHGSPWALFRSMRLAQPSEFPAYLDMGEQVLCSASPELFFRRQDDRITARPMKGTVARGASPEEDEALAQWLAASPKNRAENLMIVDMIRNDLGKIAVPGSVQVANLFQVEPYPTLHQMTSTVNARSRASLLDTLRAMFPCASITGAPKRKTMEIIRDLEPGPRGFYTGAIGSLFPDGGSEFSVAIRTAVVDRQRRRVTYGTGCGVVWDSAADEEYQEALLKAAIVRTAWPDFALIETMRGERTGILYWVWHRERLARSARELGFHCDLPNVETLLQQTCAALDEGVHRVRLQMDADGRVTLSSAPLPPVRSLRAAIDRVATPSTHPALAHKTTRRDPYDAARARCPGVEEVLLVNERGECMEFTIGNLVLRTEGGDLTPPLSSGVLPGTTRSRLLAEGSLKERVLYPSDVENADAVFLCNAVRGLVPVSLTRGNRVPPR